MDEYLLFEAFERGEYIQEQDIKKSNKLHMRSFNFLVA